MKRQLSMHIIALHCDVHIVLAFLHLLNVVFDTKWGVGFVATFVKPHLLNPKRGGCCPTLRLCVHYVYCLHASMNACMCVCVNVFVSNEAVFVSIKREGTVVFESYTMRDETVCNIEHDVPFGTYSTCNTHMHAQREKKKKTAHMG